MGAMIIREVAQKTGDVAGDGTTTATILAREMVSEGIKLLAAGFPPMEIKRGMDQALDAARGAIKAMSRPIKDRERMEQVATIAANGDSEIGKLIAEWMRK